MSSAFWDVFKRGLGYLGWSFWRLPYLYVGRRSEHVFHVSRNSFVRMKSLTRIWSSEILTFDRDYPTSLYFPLVFRWTAPYLLWKGYKIGKEHDTEARCAAGLLSYTLQSFYAIWWHSFPPDFRRLIPNQRPSLSYTSIAWKQRKIAGKSPWECLASWSRRINQVR